LSTPVPQTGLATHANILPTILDLIEVPQERRLEIYLAPLFSLDVQNKGKRRFISGAGILIDFD